MPVLPAAAVGKDKVRSLEVFTNLQGERLDRHVWGIDLGPFCKGIKVTEKNQLIDPEFVAGLLHLARADFAELFPGKSVARATLAASETKDGHVAAEMLQGTNQPLAENFVIGMRDYRGRAAQVSEVLQLQRLLRVVVGAESSGETTGPPAAEEGIGDLLADFL